MMTLQEIFDIVWTGLKAQAFKQSQGRMGLCYYRGEGGKKCAMGHLISDEEYYSSMEEISFSKLENLSPRLEELRNAYQAELTSLQWIHDMNQSTMEFDLRSFAAKHSLTIPKDSEEVCDE
jgi:hypothetical protein